MGNLHFGRQSSAPTLPERPHFNQVVPGSTQSLCSVALAMHQIRSEKHRWERR
jgi:hypothetical protein